MKPLPNPDTIIYKAPFGYAQQQLLLSEEGKPYDFRFLAVNQAYESFLGKKAENLLGQTFFGVMPEMQANGTDLIHHFANVAIQGKELEFEYYFEPLGKWCRIFAYANEDLDFTTIFYDITEKKLLAIKLQTEERLAKNYLDTSETIMVSLDITGHITMLNRYGLGFLGYSEDEIIGRNWFDTVLMQPEGLSKVYPAFLRIVNGDLESVKYFENDVITKSGACHTIAWRNEYQLDVNGRIIGTLSSGLDITERNKALKDLKASQEELKKQNALFETLIQNLQSGVFMVEAPSGKPLLANESAKQLLGRGILPDASLQNLSEVYKAKKQGTNTPYPIEEMPIIMGMFGKKAHVDDMIVERPDGTETWLEIYGSPVTNGKGTVWASLVNFHDITARKKAEKALQQSEEKYRTLFESLSQGIFYQDRQGKIIDTNNAALRMLGLSRDQLLGKDSFDPRWKVINEANEFLPPEKHPSMLALNSGQPVYNQVVGVYIPEVGRYNWILVNAIPQFLPDQDIPYQVFASMQDITALKQTQLIDECRLRLLLFAENHSLSELLEETLNEVEKLTESKIGFYHFIDEDQVTIHLQNWSTQTKASYCNAEGFGFKYPLSQAGVWADCVSEKRPVIHNDYASLPHRKGLPPGHAAVIRELVVPVIRSQKITAILGVGNKANNYSENDIEIVSRLADLAWDIAEQKLASEALLKSETLLKEMNAQKDKFFSIIAHDLRSPFNTIIGFSELLSDQVAEKDYTGIDEYARLIQKSSLRAVDLLDNLLQWAHSQTGRMEFNPDYHALDSLVEDTISLLSDTAQQKNIEIRHEIPESLTVFADKSMVSTVLRNLVSNALKFTNPGGTITLTSKQNQQHTTILVSDTGVGITPERKAGLFRLDQCESTLGTNHEKGTGLGLMLCKEFVNKHGGMIWVESEPGRGSTFLFTLPIRK